MGEHAHQEGKGESPFEQSESAASTMGIVGEAAHALNEEAGVPNAMGGAANAYDVASGVYDMFHGKEVAGGIKAAKGSSGLASLALELADKKGLAKRAGMIGAGLDVASGIRKLANGDVQGGVEDTAGGGLGFVPGVGTAAAGAWKGGNAIGRGLDAQAAKNNTFGGHRTAHRAAADSGIAAEEWVEDKVGNHTVGMIAGGLVTGGAAVVDTGRAALDAVFGGPSMMENVVAEKQHHDEALHRENVEWFAKNGDELKKTNPYAYKMMYANVGEDAKRHNEHQAAVAPMKKMNPEVYKLISHWVD